MAIGCRPSVELQIDIELEYSKSIVRSMSMHTEQNDAQQPTPTYRAWLAIRRSSLTGAVEVCARWAQFEYFLADMGRRPRGTTLVRIDENEAHGPRNSQWEASKPPRDAIGLATPAEHVERIKALQDAGLTNYEIAALLGASRIAVRDALRVFADSHG